MHPRQLFTTRHAKSGEPVIKLYPFPLRAISTAFGEGEKISVPRIITSHNGQVLNVNLGDNRPSTERVRMRVTRHALNQASQRGCRRRRWNDRDKQSCASSRTRRYCSSVWVSVSMVSFFRAFGRAARATIERRDRRQGRCLYDIERWARGQPNTSWLGSVLSKDGVCRWFQNWKPGMERCTANPAWSRPILIRDHVLARGGFLWASRSSQVRIRARAATNAVPC